MDNCWAFGANKKRAPESRARLASQGCFRIYRKFAWTLVSAFTGIVQVIEVPEQAPPHPAHVDPGSGVAVRVTDVPCTNFDEQLPPLFNPHPIPVGLLTTLPFPFNPTDRLKIGLKMAVTVADESNVNEQVSDVPWHARSQLTNT